MPCSSTRLCACSIAELYRRDCENIAHGIYRYPYDANLRHRQFNPFFVRKRFLNTFKEVRAPLLPPPFLSLQPSPKNPQSLSIPLPVSRVRFCSLNLIADSLTVWRAPFCVWFVVGFEIAERTLHAPLPLYHLPHAPASQFDVWLARKNALTQHAAWS